MVRKPSTSKNNDKILTPENAYPYQERVEQQLSSGNIKSPRALDSQLENPPPRCSPLKHPNLSVDGVETSHERNTPQEQMNQENEYKKKYATFIRKKSKHCSASVRRSERIKSAAVHPPNSNGGIEYIEDVTVSESEKDEPDTQIEQVLPEPELEPEPEPEPQPAENLSERSLDEKIDYALQRIEALDKIIELLKSKVDGNFDLHEAPSMASISYRSMYIDSQKKLEALTDENRKLTGKLEKALGKIEVLEALTVENRQLTGKLENALGKIEVYEKDNHVLREVLDTMKGTVNAAVVSNLAKTAEAAVNASTQAIHNACSVSASKRKRNES